MWVAGQCLVGASGESQFENDWQREERCDRWLENEESIQFFIHILLYSFLFLLLFVQKRTRVQYYRAHTPGHCATDHDIVAKKAGWEPFGPMISGNVACADPRSTRYR